MPSDHSHTDRRLVPMEYSSLPDTRKQTVSPQKDTSCREAVLTRGAAASALRRRTGIPGGGTPRRRRRGAARALFWRRALARARSPDARFCACVAARVCVAILGSTHLRDDADRGNPSEQGGTPLRWLTNTTRCCENVPHKDSILRLFSTEWRKHRNSFLCVWRRISSGHGKGDTQGGRLKPWNCWFRQS